MDCIFCEISAGRSPAFVVLRSELALAFLDKYPVSKGHTLVIPSKHFRDLMETPDDVISELIRVVKAVAIAQVRALGARGVRIVQNNGQAAGQEILHVHFHVIPFYDRGHLGRRELDPEEGVKVALTLSKELTSYLAKG